MAALIDVVGRATALEILLEGRVFSAEEAKEKGLINRFVADDQVGAEALAAAARIAAGRPLRRGTRRTAARRGTWPGPRYIAGTWAGRPALSLHLWNR